MTSERIDTVLRVTYYALVSLFLAALIGLPVSVFYALADRL